MKRVDKCCGGCTHFKYETTDGSGWCEVGDTKTYCGFGTDCNDFEDVETIRRERVARKEHERRMQEVVQTDWYKDVCLKCKYREMELNGEKSYCVILHWGNGRCMKILQYLKKEE